MAESGTLREGGTPCTCAVLRRATRRLTQAYDRALRPAGLKLTQFSLLANVIRSGGLPISGLARRLAMERTTLTRNLRLLESKGWVRINPGRDRRSRAVEATAAGHAAFARAEPLWRQAEGEFRAALGEADLRTLRGLLAETERAADA